MTAQQLSIMLSGMEDQVAVIKYDNKEFEIVGIEIGIDKNLGKTYIMVKEKV